MFFFITLPSSISFLGGVKIDYGSVTITRMHTLSNKKVQRDVAKSPGIGFAPMPSLEFGSQPWLKHHKQGCSPKIVCWELLLKSLERILTKFPFVGKGICNYWAEKV